MKEQDYSVSTVALKIMYLTIVQRELNRTMKRNEEPDTILTKIQSKTSRIHLHLKEF